MSSENERTLPGGAEHARAFYDEWDFARQAVRLYAAGVAWKGARIGVLLAAADDVDWRGEVEEDALREALQEWIIDGHSMLTFSREGPIQLVPKGTSNALQIRIETAGPSAAHGGTSLLWPACANHATLKRLSELIGINPDAEELLGFLLNEAHNSLRLPRWALDPAQAASAPAGVVTLELHWYRVFVHLWRRDLALSIGGGLRQQLAAGEARLAEVFFDWNEEWLPEESIRGWEGVYDAFDHCGLTLTNFGKEYAASLRGLVNAGVLSRDFLASWEERGL